MTDLGASSFSAAAGYLFFVHHGVGSEDHITLLAVGLPLVMAGSWLGDRLVFRLNAQSFSRLIAAFFCSAGSLCS